MSAMTTGRLMVDSSASTGAVLARPGPTVEVAGGSHVANWRTWTIDLPPGHYAVRVSAGGQLPADLVATVHPGQVTTIYYQARDTGQLRHNPKVVLPDRLRLFLLMVGSVVVMLLLSGVIISIVD